MTAPLIAHAINYAAHYWPVFPLNGKVPFKGSRGVLDATTDLATVAAMWSRCPYANIGGQVPPPMITIDIDPRNGGLDTLAELEATHDEPLPLTLTDYSGRGDGGAHYWFRRPPGKLTGTRLGPGIDLKTSSGYAVLPPSVHPDTGRRYTRVDRPVAAPPRWLIALATARPPPPITAPKPRPLSQFWGSVGRRRVLRQHVVVRRARAAWMDLHDGNPDVDGAIWLHPTATSACSATVRHGCLFVYSTNTPFDVTEACNPNGYTKFRAYAVLDHDGDMSAAARALRGVA